MNLNQLKIFYLIIRRGSLTDAAAELNITQPAVTKAVQRLQEHYDVRLVERSGRKWVLTAAGKALYRIADRIFKLETQAENCIRGFQEQGERRLRIDASETFGGYYLPEVVNRFQRRHPDITVSVDILPNEKVVERTASLGNDVGFISDPIRHKSLTLREVCAERLVLIGAAGHPLAQVRRLRPQDLEGQPIIMHEQGSALQKAMDELLGRKESRTTHYLEFSNNEAIKRAVAAGAGVALISEKAAAEEVRTGKLITLNLAHPPARRAFFMVFHKGKHISHTLKSLMEMVDQWAAGRD
jgi:DNA-binding transcriptional LysR family regulator